MSTVYQQDLFERQKNPFKQEFRVFSDGSNYIARKVVRSGKRGETKRFKSDYDFLFDFIFDSVSKDYFAGNNRNDKNYGKLIDMVCQVFIDDYGFDSDFLRPFVTENVMRRMKNVWAREKRFRQKAYLNRWNYFVTFTYDSKKHTEESFIKRLRKCLSNLHTRRGWRFMGVTEHGEENGRFHYHFLVYVPEGQMVGRLEEKKDYSTKRGCVQNTVSNTFFERQFGRNDFSEVKNMQFKNGDAVAYLLKYLRKGNERVIYSRGIPSEISKELDVETDICCSVETEHSTKYILFDNVIDYRSDVMPFQSIPIYVFRQSA